MLNHSHSLAMPKHPHVRDRSRHGGARLFDRPRPFGSFEYWQGGGRLWLLPVVVVSGVVAAYLMASEKPVSSRFCDTVRALEFNGPKSCRDVVWVRAKSKTVVRPISPRQPNSRRS